ncbi:MAG: S-adenosylmethionine:tRNA ribosyltransferase-isomerase [Opitutaceae bacterium]|nr:S-adenosylmethionine:tRNA ribosyltransferase-isomerase [Cytophagales bacterium]
MKFLNNLTSLKSMTHPEIDLHEYKYDLPEAKIPNRPLDKREQSKLLVYKNEIVTEDVFYNIADHLPKNTLLVFNDSKVIPARLFFQTTNKASIEILCLNQIDIECIDNPGNQQTWKCIVGNLKRWKEGNILSIDLKIVILSAELIERNGEDNDIRFSWTGELTFLEVLELAGNIPLPPYMNRMADEDDNIRYQTVYAKSPGSVAAPTAGLHFTDKVLDEIKIKGVEISYITLHVGAGTFKPIKSSTISGHKMHEETFEVSASFLTELHHNDFVIPVGTTSLRTLESICILGDKVSKGDFSMIINQWDGFSENVQPAKKSISSLLLWMKQNEKEIITVKTSILIVPGYRFRICKGLVTNFHQPESTLILLVAAFLGENWKKVYDYALENDFRFLSYGDSSILLP